MNKHNQIVGFKWTDDITLDENESYNDIKITMDTLSSDITKEQENTIQCTINTFIGI